MKHLSYKKKEKILAEYFETKISMNRLALKNKVNRNTIRKWLSKKGLRNHYHKASILDDDEITRLYVKDRKSCEEIAHIFNVSVRPIKTILKKKGVHRTQADSMMGKWTKDKNPNWKGGITTYRSWQKFIPFCGKRFLIFKETVLLRDRYTCRKCGSKTKVEVHHLVPVRDVVDEFQLFDVNGAITICRKCHLHIHFKEYDYIEYFRDLIDKSSPV